MQTRPHSPKKRLKRWNVTTPFCRFASNADADSGTDFTNDAPSCNNKAQLKFVQILAIWTKLPGQYQFAKDTCAEFMPWQSTWISFFFFLFFKNSNTRFKRDIFLNSKNHFSNHPTLIGGKHQHMVSNIETIQSKLNPLNLHPTVNISTRLPPF